MASVGETESRVFDLAALEEGQSPLTAAQLRVLAPQLERAERSRAVGAPIGPHSLPDPYAAAEGAAGIAVAEHVSAPALRTVDIDAPAPPPLIAEGHAATTIAPSGPAAAPLLEPTAPTPELAGLTSVEVAQRLESGLVNQDTSRTRGEFEIIRSNVFTYFNMVLGGLIGALVVLGFVDRAGDHLQDAGFVGLIVVINVIVGTYQEIRATRKLRDIVALTAPTALVVRDGREQEIVASEVVQDDLVLLRSGDQVVADGPVVWDTAEIDESINTGETQSVRRAPGDQLESGAFCTGGSCYYRALHVGSASRAVRETADARQLRKVETPLQLRFRRILRVLMVATIILGGLLLISFTVNDRPIGDAIKSVIATATSVVPEGLLLGFTVAFAVGALRVAKMGAFVQDNTAVEALNYVDTVCLDKTGTITANRLVVDDIHWAEGGRSLRGWLGAFALETVENNQTARALADATGRFGNGATAAETVPFNSERRWSAARMALGSEQRIFVLGAPERVLRVCPDADELLEDYELATQRGLRGVVIAESPILPDPELDELPEMRVVALITIADELRPEITGAFRLMEDLGIEPKIISGDNPATVAALIQQLGITLRGGIISGAQLARLDEAELDEAVEANSVFGRVAPQQKEQIIAALKRQGHYVAMVGDGQNDVRALREADVAVAMESGTNTARGVAGIVLRNDSFEALVRGTRIAQTVLGNCSQLSKLFVTKSVYAFLIIFMANMMGLEFPFLPRHGSLTALFTLGVPAVFITLTTPPPTAGRDFIGSTLRFALPAALALAISAVSVHLLSEGFLNRPIEDSRTLVSSTIGIVGLGYMVEVIGFEGASRERLMRPALVTFFGIALLGMFILTLYTPALRTFFDFRPMSADEWAMVITASVAAFGGKYLISRFSTEAIRWFSGAAEEEAASRGRAG